MSADPFQVFDTPARVNIGSCLSRAAAEWPDQPAIVVARRNGERIDFRELEARSNRLANGLRAKGVTAGTRVSLFLYPGIELITVTYALFKIGAVPVIADPGMGRKRLLACLEKMRPTVFIGVPRAQVVRKLYSASFESVKLVVTAGPRLFFRGTSIAGLSAGQPDTLEIEDTASGDPAAILFTSGSTGPPKGVLYTHGMFHAQVQTLGRLYRFEPGEVDLCCFPLFALFDVAFGMTSVFPEMDVSRPGSCDPRKIVEAALEHGATTTFGSPAIWRRVVPWCMENAVKLEALKRVLVAGAPVATDLIHDFHAVLPMDGDVQIPYGATEALPVASVDGRDVVPGLVDQIQAGAGTCVGAVAPGIDLRLIRITDEALVHWSDDLEISLGQFGEICVRGPAVTHEYVEEHEHTELAKIRHPDGSVWHRMGDVGRFDDEGRLWFYGRKSHRLETRTGIRMPVPTENVFNTHPRVARTALIGVGKRGEELPVLVVEPKPGELPKTEVMTEGFIMQLRAIGRKTAITAELDTFLFRPSFPVDVRHNAKIHREELKAWAEELLA